MVVVEGLAPAIRPDFPVFFSQLRNAMPRRPFQHPEGPEIARMQLRIPILALFVLTLSACNSSADDTPDQAAAQTPEKPAGSVGAAQQFVDTVAAGDLFEEGLLGEEDARLAQQRASRLICGIDP